MATYRCDDTRGCVMQFWPPDDEHMCSNHVEAWNKTYCETKILYIKLVNYWDKYTDMHGQHNIKNYAVRSQVYIISLYWYIVVYWRYVTHYTHLLIHNGMASVKFTASQ